MFRPDRRAVLLAASLAVASAAPHAGASDFPSKSVSLIVPNPPGGVVDTSARLVSEPLAKGLGQPVVVDNRPGGSGNIAYGLVARAPKDGYTLLVSYSAYHVANPTMMSRLPWEQKDLVPVALLTTATNVIAVHPSVPAGNLREFIAHLKANPGRLNFASQGTGSLSHIGTALFEQVTQTDMQHVPYKGSGAAIQDVLAGNVQVFITTPPSVMGHVQSGRLRALAIAAKQRFAQMPGVPTTAEAGLPGFELEAWVGLFAPAGTPPDVVAKLSAEVKRALEAPEAKQRATAAGVDIRYEGPTELAARVARETDYWGKLIRARNITAD
jgi:tripartite-type tricarboxylate transporter receptor subunit TctC